VKVLDAIREHARARPDHPALVVAGTGNEADTVVSYAALVSGFEALAAKLRDAGVAPGDRCGLRAIQGRPFVEHALGILSAGGCMVPIPDDTTGEALEIASRETHLHHRVEAMPAFAYTRFEAVTPVDGADDARFRALEPAYLRFTSGTTHLRKGVVVGAASVAARIENANQSLEIGPEDRILWLLPMAHHFLVSILLYLRFGATLLLPAGSLAASVLGFANRQQATVFYASPFHYQLLAKDKGELRLDGVRLAVSTADGLRADVAERFQERFGFALVQALGIIEVGLPVLNRVSANQKPTALGRPAPGYDVWLRGDDGSRLAHATEAAPGEICIGGTGLFDAYLAPFTPAAELLEQGSFRTGDQGYFDAEGDLHLCGRRSNRINLAGMKFFCEEVEAALDTHPDIVMSRVFAKIHPHLGEIPAAEIVVRVGAEAPERKQLVAHLKDRLAGYKIPRTFSVVEALERTATGKVQRHRQTPKGGTA
jgi:long-chain acyl-CoA synthetase